MQNTIKNLTSQHTRQLNNWTQSVSDYILQRRAQTKNAYSQNGGNPTVAELNSADDETVFQALLIALGQELEAGHTIIELTEYIKVEEDINLQGSHWQNQILIKVLQPWQGIVTLPNTDTAVANKIDDKIADKNEKQDSADTSVQDFINFCFDSQTDLLLAASNIDKNNKKLLIERKQLAQRLASIIKEFSLLQFSNFLASHALFTPNQAFKHTENQSLAYQAPIVFKLNQNNSKLVFWLHRSWFAERSIIKNIARINHQTPQQLSINDYLSPTLNDGQKLAIVTANQHAFSIITGGPGTGKTYTVAQLVMALHQAHNKQNRQDASKQALSLSLAAPTGKAAQRMQESLQSAISAAGLDIQLKDAKTIHRLLGIGVTGKPRYHANNPLSEDIIIVDEASMLGVELASYLLDAVKSGARLILLGDAYQLAAVDAGSVLADLCQLTKLKDNHQTLHESKRFNDESGVGKLAKIINENASENKFNALLDLFDNQDSLAFYALDNSQLTGKNITFIEQQYSQYFAQSKILLDEINNEHLTDAQLIQKAGALLNTFNRFRILTAGHQGYLGDDELNARLETTHKNQLRLPLSSSNWYHARPIMISKNNYHQSLYNGDIGLCLKVGNEFKLYFEHKSALVPVNMLNESDLSTAYAMTIHKSQGSEFDHVAIMLDKAGERLLSQELIYTAVTRAKQKVSIFSNQQALQVAITTPTIRQTGLGMTE